MSTLHHYTIAELNALDQAAFTAALDGIFEETPSIACQAWHARPFRDRDLLHGAMVDVVRSLPQSEQLALIKAHPDLGSRTKMADASVQEQTRVGLNHLSPTEYDQFTALNNAYKKRFGFPFIIAVGHHTKESILAAFETRLQNSPEQEQAQALAEIFAIAALRLENRVAASP
ncbi:2-oxo-4-hydroxy-4-carboxy-5-ureidoimidazoline decarboxylase [Spirulina major CS-329]|jgi:2-oxo-4-hydroxy-4-carboxy-5-ureidoimidazoline decarboxylase|uniref:2-oxo-4-hydroxy-4-carboxy-5-ureidoimidazoline decarboxylase n=1 Tax=Spirulina TaxID=1154 RepID=UPI00232F8A9A|nr:MULTISPECIES: 2-oxo-4-hydroxy-4-carboxy-5-ureidoimidazoline decarboxylase [Spirulina]MDB9495055.1 2-oxo-4-hydroxy-4-carboxy-5-ureidoimidazoline decarboxylase [Spirulina subsalsa CS-330]MDB9503277.1 2-oxo-4-hydroxy-4-carboxy-5-ureidoimidazoline decarboxylase [Spirulina major CS-329]